LAHGSTTDRDRHFAAVQNQLRHDFDRLAQRIGRVTGAFHKFQQLDDSFFVFRTLQIELVSEPPARRWKVGESEFASLIEFPLDRKLRLVDPYAKIGRTLRQLAQQSKADG
jgi:hypothetical protein